MYFARRKEHLQMSLIWIVITIKNLSKKYKIRHEQRHQYGALRDVLQAGARRIVDTIKNPLAGFKDGNQEIEEFWALDDVSLDIMPGERVGIVGRNGAGKSTMLKLLSRITEPTKGQVKLGGRVASLLEVVRVSPRTYGSREYISEWSYSYE